jgi:hypothetical protein
MPLRIGLVAYPAFLLAIHLAKPSAVAAFEKARAYSPETSRRPTSLRVPRKAARRAIRKGLLIPAGDGRYYWDRRAVRRSDRKAMIFSALALAVFVLLLWLMW